MKERYSEIEFLKIIGMVLIVVSHVTQTLYTSNQYFEANYIYEIKYATTSIRNLLLALMASFGAQENVIFFICSS